MGLRIPWFVVWQHGQQLVGMTFAASGWLDDAHDDGVSGDLEASKELVMEDSGGYVTDGANYAPLYVLEHDSKTITAIHIGQSRLRCQMPND
jgi:hypothetical protein